MVKCPYLDILMASCICNLQTTMICLVISWVRTVATCVCFDQVFKCWFWRRGWIHKYFSVVILFVWRVSKPCLLLSSYYWCIASPSLVYSLYYSLIFLIPFQKKPCHLLCAKVWWSCNNFVSISVAHNPQINCSHKNISATVFPQEHMKS